MSNKPHTRSKWLTIRLSPEEYEQVLELARQTTCRYLSEYARKLVLQRPINVRYRNQSLDDFLADMAPMRKELHLLSEQFRQHVQRLHTLPNARDLQTWLLQNEEDKTQLFRQIEAIQNKLNDTYQLWSHV